MSSFIPTKIFTRTIVIGLPSVGGASLGIALRNQTLANMSHNAQRAIAYKNFASAAGRSNLAATADWKEF